MQYIFNNVAVHPRKRVPALPKLDWAGREWPTELSDVYDRYSDAKAVAYRDCRKLYQAMNGCDFRITSYNTFGFCVAFHAPDPDTGELMAVFITPRHRDAYFVE